jgi:Derlin-2/3
MDFGNLNAAAANDAAAGFDLFSWNTDIPIISRLYFTGAFLTTAGVSLDIISPFSLYFNFDLIFFQGQIWRLVTTYLFFGMFSVDFLFHMYFLVRYCRMLEEGDFRGKTAHFVLMIAFGVGFMTAVAPFVSVHFLGSSLTFMMVYVWGRRNEDMRMSFLGFFTFNAPYLPWVMLMFSVLLGNAVTIDAIGILVGHTYYFLEYVYPKVAEIRGWRRKRILEPPRVLHWICGTLPLDDNDDVNANVVAAAVEQQQQQLHLHQD